VVVTEPALIISASYRTDLPAFHGARFQAQLDAGHAMVRNPYSGKEYRVSLAQDDIDGFIFWTRNAKPFRAGFKAAQVVAPFFVQYTVTGYPALLERGVPPIDHAVAEVERLVGQYGVGSVVWRYDPVIWTAATQPDFHRTNFRKLADRLAGSVDEVIFSAATLYAKSNRNLKRYAPGLDVSDPADAEKQALLSELGEFALERGITPTVCSQPQLLSGPLKAAKCVDAERLKRIGGIDFRHRLKGNRAGCECAESRDIGGYDSCAHGCLYCYAVNDHDKVRQSLSAS
jgi:hypothetical protein